MQQEFHDAQSRMLIKSIQSNYELKLWLLFPLSNARQWKSISNISFTHTLFLSMETNQLARTTCCLPWNSKRCIVDNDVRMIRLRGSIFYPYFVRTLWFFFMSDCCRLPTITSSLVCLFSFQDFKCRIEFHSFAYFKLVFNRQAFTVDVFLELLNWEFTIKYYSELSIWQSD